MKRRSPYEANRQRALKRRRDLAVARAVGLAPPPRTTGPYGGRVPLRTGGYRLNNAERKVQDIVTTTYNVSTTGSFTLLSNPSLGSDFDDRIGRKIVNKSFFIRGHVVNEAAVAGSLGYLEPQLIRMIIFCDMQPNGAAPSVTDLLVEAKPQSQLNLNNRDRFRVYTDKEWVFDSFINFSTDNQSRASASRQIHPIKKYKKINLETIFNSTNGGSIGDIASGALYMFWIGSQTAGVSNDSNAVVSTRVRYADA